MHPTNREKEKSFYCEQIEYARTMQQVLKGATSETYYYYMEAYALYQLRHPMAIEVFQSFLDKAPGTTSKYLIPFTTALLKNAQRIARMRGYRQLSERWTDHPALKDSPFRQTP